MTECNFQGCVKDVWSRGLCGTHYAQWRKGKTLTPIKDRTRGKCTVDGCDLPHYGRGMCQAHHMRDYKGSTFDGPVRPMRTKGIRPCGKSRCRPAHRLLQQLHYLENKEAYVERAASRPAEELNKHRKAWKGRNKAKVKADVLARQRGLKMATPAWLSKEQWLEMNEIYATCPVGYHVDHIVPLRGKDICGLHVPWNLQHLSAEDNMAKGNAYDEADDMLDTGV